MTTWTKIAKATGTTYTKLSKPSAGAGAVAGGTPIGLLLALTTAGNASTLIWTSINKASGTSWTKIAKAT